MLRQDKSLDTFFSLLRSGMYGRPIPAAELPDHIDWNAVMSFARKHTVAGLIIDSVQSLPDNLQPDPVILAKMRKLAMTILRSNMLLDKTAAQLVSFFRSHGIGGTLLKGQGVARYYRVPEMRQPGDIDYYVGKDAYKEAIRLCHENLMNEDSDCHTTEKHFAFRLNLISIELHRIAIQIYSPVYNRRLQKWLNEQLHHSQGRTLSIANTDIPLPSYDFDAIFIFYHAWQHFIVGGIGLRQLCDWALLFHSHADEIDREQLIRNIRRFGMTKGWKFFAYIAVRYLGLDKAKMPLYDPSVSKAAEKILDDILEGGNFGFYSKAHLRLGDQTRTGLKVGFGKLRNILSYFSTLFPLIPSEATILLFYRLAMGSFSFTKRSISHRSKN